MQPMQPEAPAPPIPRRWSRWLLAALLLLAVAAFYALGLSGYFSWDSLRGRIDQWQAEVRQHLGMALLIFFGIYVAATALSLPVATGLTLIGGALFDRWLGTAVVSVSSTLGATLAMLASRHVLRDWVQRRFGRRLEALQQGVERDGAYYLLMLRLVAVFPFFLINLGMGLTRMPARTFAAVSWLGMLPATFVYVNAGREWGNIHKPADVLSPGVLLALVLLGLLPLVARKLVRIVRSHRTGG